MDFHTYDRRGYPVVDARTGYAGWAATYEDTVQDAMDLDTLDALAVDWTQASTVADLACGTGRTGAWLKRRGAGEIDGVDLTPEMLARARERGVHRSLREADVSDTGLEPGYDLAIASLVDEHLEDLAPLYREAARLAPRFVIVGFHPQFLMVSGMPTHYDAPDGPLTIETYVHPLSEHAQAARAAGLALIDLRERLVDDAWIALKPKWEPMRGHPVAFAFAWQRA